MNRDTQAHKIGAGLLALMVTGSLAAGSVAAHADDPTPKDKGAGKPGKKQDSIPIKIVPPIIVPDKGPDKGKDGKDADKTGK